MARISGSTSSGASNFDGSRRSYPPSRGVPRQSLPLKEFNPTPEQSQVIDLTVWLGESATPIPRLELIHQPRSSHVVVVQGVPGCGKTATGVRAIATTLNANPHLTAKIVAFNKDAANEFASRLSTYRLGHLASTAHSYGWGMISRAYGSPEFNKYKYYDVLDIAYPKGKQLLGSDRKQLVGLCDMWRNYLLTTDPNHIGESHLDLAANYPCFELKPADAIEIARLMIIHGNADLRSVDHTDMISVPHYSGIVEEPYDIVMVDEYQDTNPAQQSLMTAAGRNLICIGDPNQAIYAFRGAGTRVMEDLLDWADETQRVSFSLALTCNFRSETSIVSLACRTVPEMQPRPGAGPGHVQYDMQMGDILTIGKTHLNQGHTVKVLARRNAPLITYFLKMIMDQTPCYRFVGEDGDSLLLTLRESAKSAIHAPTMPAAVKIVEDFYTHRLGLLNSRDRPSKTAIQNIEDCRDCMRTILEYCTTPSSITTYLNKLAPSKPDPTAVQFSTIHKAKGTEAHTVIIVGLDHFGPDAFGYRISAYPLSDEEREQEVHLAFVAITRAEKFLGFSGTPAIYGPQEDAEQVEGSGGEDLDDHHIAF